MSTQTQPPPTRTQRPPTGSAPRVDSAQWSMTVTPVVAAFTTLCASTAMAGVISGMRWLGYAGVAIIVVTAVGLGLRAIRTPVLVVGFAQMLAVLCLLVALFTNSGILGIFPGPAAFSELGDVPTLVLWGNEDRVICAADAHRLRDHSSTEVHVARGIGHMLPLEAPGWTNAHIIRFLGSLRQPVLRAA